MNTKKLHVKENPVARKPRFTYHDLHHSRAQTLHSIEQAITTLRQLHANILNAQPPADPQKLEGFTDAYIQHATDGLSQVREQTSTQVRELVIFARDNSSLSTRKLSPKARLGVQTIHRVWNQEK